MVPSTSAVEANARTRVMRFDSDAWLAEVLARPVFSVHDVDGAADTTRAVEEHARGAPGAFYFAKLGSADVAHLGALSAAGFRVVEASVTFARPAAMPAARTEMSSSVHVLPAIPAWRERVLDVAGSAFRYSRFHLDPEFDPAAANRVKREWIRSYFDGRRGDRLLVAVDEGEPVGFLAFMRVHRSGGPVGVIDLIGVRSDRQGLGIGQRLIAAAAGECEGKADTLEVGTQIANVPSIRLYEQAGFKAVRTGFVLHFHVPAR